MEQNMNDETLTPPSSDAARPQSDVAALMAAAKDPQRAISALEALGLLGPAAAACAPMLHDLLGDEVMRSAAMAALAQIIGHPADALAAGKRFLHDPSAAVRRSAVRAVRAANPADVDALACLLPMLKDEDAEVRREVIQTFGAARAAAAPAAIDLLTIYANQGDDLWIEAATALCLMGEAIVPAMRLVLRERRYYALRGAARELLEANDSASVSVAGAPQRIARVTKGTAAFANGASDPTAAGAATLANGSPSQITAGAPNTAAFVNGSPESAAAATADASGASALPADVFSIASPTSRSVQRTTTPLSGLVGCAPKRLGRASSPEPFSLIGAQRGRRMGAPSHVERAFARRGFASAYADFPTATCRAPRALHKLGPAGMLGRTLGRLALIALEAIVRRQRVTEPASSSDAAHWHCCVGRRASEPISLGDIRAAFDQRRVPATMMFWRPGLPGWTHPSQIPELRFAPPQAVAPAPSRRAA
jgi:hypothetical protein